jgi:hypothetical protein
MAPSGSLGQYPEDLQRQLDAAAELARSLSRVGTRGHVLDELDDVDLSDPEAVERAVVAGEASAYLDRPPLPDDIEIPLYRSDD